ncbi:MAG: carbonic anhydrase [Gammaproteobacteria bacterium]
MKPLQHLFDNNLRWADSMKEQDPGFFTRLAEQQSPEYLWIGCSDSRVPANQITNLPPGDVFVHRNVANLVVHTDLNCLSVIQYAVEVLKVKHIILCGHYGCGGIKAALENQEHGLIDNWLRHVRDVYRFNKSRFEGLDDDQQSDLLCELNISEQVENICHTTIVQKAWRGGSDLNVHGWVYGIKDGVLKELVSRSAHATNG